jgi:hypothetical protein
MEPEGSSPHSQTPATYPYPEPTQSSPHTHIPLLEDPFLWGLLDKIRGPVSVSYFAFTPS